MVDIEKFQAFSLRACQKGRGVQRIMAAALAAADPAEAVRRAVKYDGNILKVGGHSYALDEVGRVFVLAVGKAAAAMAGALIPLLNNKFIDGILVTKYMPSNPIGTLKIIQSGHPVPDERSLYAGGQVADLLSEMTEDDLVFCLLSGGGSALMTLPVEGVEMADLQALTASLLVCGASIAEINTLRRHLDRLKGGGLARLASQAHVVSLILSDVVGDPLEAIASGPTAPDPTTCADALRIIAFYGLRSTLPAAVVSALERGIETPKPGDDCFGKVQNIIIGSNIRSAQAALTQARREGFHQLLLTTHLQGEASQAGRIFASILRQVAGAGQPAQLPACLIAGGETTVALRSLSAGSGRGGRNQELALGAVNDLAGLTGVMLVTLATDGEDGSTDAAGAIVTGDTLQRAQALGLDIYDHLQRNDSYAFFGALDDLLKPGPTGTNVNDLVFLFAF